MNTASYRRYQEELKIWKRMDFDDQMCYAKRILETCPPVLEYFLPERMEIQAERVEIAVK